MLFLLSSAPDTKEFKTALKLAKETGSDICLLQNAVYASESLDESKLYLMEDDLQLRGINGSEVSGEIIDYGRLVDLMTDADKVVGLF